MLLAAVRYCESHKKAANVASAAAGVPVKGGNMVRSMVARCLALLCAVFPAAPTLLAQAPVVKEKLPDGVMRRLGGGGMMPLGSGGLRGHHAAMSPDGKLIATSATDGAGTFKFCLLNASDGKLIYSMESKDFAAMYDCVFSHDSKLLAGNEAKDGVVQGCLWDVALRQSRFVLPVGVLWPGSPAPVFSPDDKVVAFVAARNPGRGHIHLFDVATGKLRQKLPYQEDPRRRDGAMAFLPDGKTLVVSDESGKLRFWDVARGTKVREIQLKGNKSAVDRLAVSPDGKRLAINQCPLFCVVELDSGKELYRLPNAFCQAIAFSPDGKYLLRGVEGEDAHFGKSRIEMLEPATGKELGRLRLAGLVAQKIQFTSDGKTLMACGNDHYVRTWSFPDLKPRLEPVGHANRVEALVFSPDGKILCSRDEIDRYKRIFWEVASGQPKHFWADTYTWDEAYITPGGTHFVECNNYNGVIKVYEIATGKQVQKLEEVAPGKQVQKLNMARGPVAMAPDGKTLAVGREDHEIFLWDVLTGKELRRFKGQTNRALSMAISPDGRWLAAATEKTVRVWWTATGELFRTFKYNEPWSRWPPMKSGRLVFSSDGQWLAIDGDGGSRTWDVLAGNRVHATLRYDRLFLGDSQIYTVLLSSDERWKPFLIDFFRDRVATPLPAWARGSYEPGDLPAGVHSHPAPRLVVALSRDRTMFAAPDKDGTILVARTADFFEKPKQAAIPAKRIADLWSDLGARKKDGYKALKAFQSLSYGDRDVVAFLAKKLSPVKGPDAKQLAKWLADLDSKDAKVRAAANKELRAWGPAVEMSLRNAYEGMGKEGRTESKSLLDRIEKKLVEEVSLRTLKAIAVLAAMGTPEARELLSRLATGAAGSRITESARLALPRTAK
jgi:WD40 repeat protein